MASTSELIRRLKAAKFKLAKHGKKHDLYVDPGGREIYVWRHSREIPRGTYERILHDAGIK